ncbi:uncharacterized protein LOC125670665 isoform X2 [Ostrea edulis]|uniref:uncharacterized protein LOC125670665 isoform X2 n=1 Tax=Ostrea edulis TaxID=37623 RepID=UPI0024AEB83A|nr:uncharacterized protein LOC125670665 isoform X2 [Ostrea edulis]
MATGLGNTELIVLASILGTFVVLFSLAIGTYCYKKYDYIKRKKHGSTVDSGKRLSFLQDTKPGKCGRVPTSNNSLRQIIHSTKPIPQPVLRNPQSRIQNDGRARSSRSPRDVQIYNSYPGGVRVVRFHQDHNKPVLVYRPDLPRPLYTQPHLPNTVPHLRLGDYRPKVVSGYFSPDTRHMEAFRNPETSLNSSSSRFNWIPAEPEKVKFFQLDKKDTPTKAGKHRHKVTKSSATSTSGLRFSDPPPTKTTKQNANVSTQYIESGSKFVIIDYVDLSHKKSGDLPLSTSTPRDDHQETTDRNHNFIPRQRKPQDGSLEKIPAF